MERKLILNQLYDCAATSFQFTAEKGALDYFTCYIPVCAEANDLCFLEVQIEFGQRIPS